MEGLFRREPENHLLPYAYNLISCGLGGRTDNTKFTDDPISTMVSASVPSRSNIINLGFIFGNSRTLTLRDCRFAPILWIVD